MLGMKPVLLALCIILLHLAGADHYKTLGLESKSATHQQIKSAFRKLSLKYHPDKTKGDPEAQKKFVEISKAYEILSDDTKRSKYDLYGEDADSKQVNNPFGRNGQRGQDMQAKVEVALEELYSGGHRDVSIQRQEICSHCRGTGARDGETKQCPHCKGHGKVVQLQQMGFMQIQTQQICSHCKGTGRVPSHPCPHCGGHGVVTKPKHFRIEIEKGMKHGEQIRFEKAASQQPGVTPGDVIFVLQERKHDRFVRNGLHLEIQLEITLLEALIGFEKVIRHLDGRVVSVSDTGVSTHGQVIVIPREGMPEHENPSHKGELRVKLKVKFPSSLSSYHRRELEKIL